MRAAIWQIIIVLAKVLLLYLAAPFLWGDLVLMHTALPRLLFEERPFVLSVLFCVVLAAAISIGRRSKLPMLLTVCVLAYCPVFLVFDFYATVLMAALMVVAVIHFLRRNRYTEPLLVLLPVVAGAWVFLSVVYQPFFVGWANYVTGRLNYVGSVIEGLVSLKEQSIQALIVLPPMAMYFLAKRSYVSLCARSVRNAP